MDIFLIRRKMINSPVLYNSQTHQQLLTPTTTLHLYNRNRPVFFTNKTLFSTPEATRTKAMATGPEDYNRLAEVKKFDESKIGVKGLVDSGLTTIPRFFIHPPETLLDLKPKAKTNTNHQIPTVDLSGDRSKVVEQVSRACREYGFFQVVNHGIPLEVLDNTVRGIREFHELPQEEKARFYRRDVTTGVSYLSNIDLFVSQAASWRDTLQMKLGPTLPELEHIPEICRKELIDWNDHSKKLGEHLMELLCEGLGVNSSKLKDLTFLEARTMAAHYYPYCPQPDLTVGIKSHTDPGVLTLVLQDHIGGLQVKHGEEWLDVKPVPGAIVVNVGDIMQILSNEEYISVEHRVVANTAKEARISIAIFFNPLDRDSMYGPFPELITPEKPALYRQFSFKDYITRFFTKELDGKSLTNYYKL